MAINSVGLGTNSTIGVGAAGQTANGTFTSIGGITSGSMSIEVNSVDTTNNDDVGFTSMVPGNATITLDVTCRYDPVTDSAQGTVETLIGDLDNGGTAFKALKAWQVRPLGATSGEASFAFDGYVTSYSINAGENDSPVDVSFTVQSVGASIATAAPSYAAVP